MSAEERRELVVRAAVTEFARGGYFGTSTEAIAKRVGVSQPYLFRLFPNKLALFQAAADRCVDDTVATFERAAEGLTGEAALDAMADAYSALVTDRDTLLMQMQLYVAVRAVDNPELYAHVRMLWRRLWEAVRLASGADDREMHAFISSGMLINALVAMGIPGDDRSWAGFDDEACKSAATEVATGLARD